MSAHGAMVDAHSTANLAVADAPAELRLDADRLRALRTPCYLFDPAAVVENYRRLKLELGTRLIVSLKANPNVDLLLRTAHAFIDGVELASRGELDLVVVRTLPKFLNTPALDAPLLRAAVASRARLVLDSPAQAAMIVDQADRARLMPLVLRLNCGDHIAGLVRKPCDHFGMDREDVVAVARLLTANSLSVDGIHLFAGSNGFFGAAWAVLELAREVAGEVEGVTGKPLSLVNLGGGFPLGWPQVDFDWGTYREAVSRSFAPDVAAHEAGRAVFGSAGLFMTRVLGSKHVNGCHVVVCDGGMAQSFLLARTESLLAARAVPELIEAATARRSRVDEPILLVGSSCSSADRIGRVPAGGQLPLPGDFYVFRDTGAYHSTYTVSRFLSLPEAAIYIQT